MIIDGWLGGGEGSERHANGMILLLKISKCKIATSPAVSASYRCSRTVNAKRRRNGRETTSSVGVPTGERRETRHDRKRIADGRTVSADRAQSTTIVKITIK